MTEEIKHKTEQKKSFCKRLSNNGRSESDCVQLQSMVNEPSEIISKRKDDYHEEFSKKINDPETSSKAYWSILKSFYSGNKVPLISPLLVNDSLVSNFKDKANHFNEYFNAQCNPITNNSSLPSSLMYKGYLY